MVFTPGESPLRQYASSATDTLVGIAWPGLQPETTLDKVVLDAEVCVDSEEFIQPFFLCEPPQQVRLFIQLFCLSVAASLVVHRAGAKDFYKLLLRSQPPPDQRRGLGYTACKAYGVIPVPRLPEKMFSLVRWTLVATLVLACHTSLAPRFFLFASFGLYFLYFGQLFCESKHGGHGSLLMPSVILLLALSGGPEGSPWSLVFVKIFLGVIYLSGALSKLLVSAFMGKRWGGATMQAYVFDAMWCRPHRWAIVRGLQRELLKRWWACRALAMGGLVFELGFFPLVLLGGQVGSVVAATVALGFHIGVDLLQGLDFMPFWCPVFWAFLPDLQGLLTGRAISPDETWYATVAQGFEEEPCRWMLSAAYLVMQVIVAIRFQDLFEGKEALPFTCCPMFAVPRNMFSDELRGGVLTDSNFRDGGHIDVMYNFAPWCSDLPMSAEDLQRVPYRMLMWISTLHCDPKVERLLGKSFLGQELVVCANFEVPKELQMKLRELVRTLEECRPEDWSSPAKVEEVLNLQGQCQALFQAGRESGLECGPKVARRPLEPPKHQSVGFWIGRPVDAEKLLQT
jgi:hypothetical protein